jgi:hypothetical protein
MKMASEPRRSGSNIDSRDFRELGDQTHFGECPVIHLQKVKKFIAEALECSVFAKARAMANILAAQSAEMRAKAETMLQQADRLLCESWNEQMWSDGEPIDPSPTIDQAINGGFAWLEI